MDAVQCILGPQVLQLDLRQEPLLGHPIYELVGDVSPSGGPGPRTACFSQVARTRDTGELVQVSCPATGQLNWLAETLPMALVAVPLGVSEDCTCS